MEVLIRYNHKSTSNNDRWCLVLDGIEHIVSDIEINSPSRTVQKIVTRDGEPVVKWHISPFDFTEVAFATDKEQTAIWVRIR